MIISVWRYCHFALAVSSFLFLTVAALTGIVLAFEPVVENARGYRLADTEKVNLAQSLPLIRQKIKGIQELKVDENGFVMARYTDTSGRDKTAYIHPLTAELLGEPQKQAPLFEWTTALHRSLFLHETGRVLVGITAFLLFLIALSGAALMIQRQKGFRRFFSPIEKTGFAQYYHAVLGRVSLLFILSIALSGSYLTVSRFFVKPQKPALRVAEESIREEPEKKPVDFAIFQQTRLAEVETVQFPFSEFPEDYYTLQLKNRVVAVNQFTGEVLAQAHYPDSYALAAFSLRWHTGRGQVWWALVLAIASTYILFFIYSGFVIAWKRVRSKSKNRYKADDCRIILLVGSENGSTYRFASALFQQLLKHGEKAYLTDLDRYTSFPKAEHLLVFTSTYGEGDPPSNAKNFAARLPVHPQQQTVSFSVVGFGSRAYVHFAQFGADVDHWLRQQAWARPVMDLVTVNDNSPQDFSAWLTAYTKQTGLPLLMPRHLLQPVAQKLEKLTVVEKTAPDAENVFLLRLKAKRLQKIASGDLLAVYPKNDHRERLYSIGKVDQQIQLSVKLHQQGLGSSFLEALKEGDTLPVRLVKNQHFHFPGNVPQVVMIANGTGIAPFLGMISENSKMVPCTLYCGFRTSASFDLYRSFLTKATAEKKLAAFHLALSREGEKQYVSHLLQREGDALWHLLTDGGVVMICGSLSMQKDVLAVLELLCRQKGDELIRFLDKGQVRTDCY